MLKLYYAPQSRAIRLRGLLDALGAGYELIPVDIVRNDGTGQADEKNPHPDKKVPALDTGDAVMTESAAMFAWATARYPSELAPHRDENGYAAYLNWLSYYGGVMEPVAMMALGGIDHPLLTRNFRDIHAVYARIEAALEGQDYILGNSYSAVDLLLSSAFLWFREGFDVPPRMGAWIARCAEHPIYQSAIEKDAALMHAA